MIVFRQFKSKFVNKTIEVLTFIRSFLVDECEMPTHFGSKHVCRTLTFIYKRLHFPFYFGILSDNTWLINYGFNEVRSFFNPPGTTYQFAGVKRCFLIQLRVNRDFDLITKNVLVFVSDWVLEGIKFGDQMVVECVSSNSDAVCNCDTSIGAFICWCECIRLYVSS